jgi:hypothetical protein
MRNVLLGIAIISLFIASGCTQTNQNTNAGWVPCSYRVKLAKALPENLYVGETFNGKVVGWSLNSTPTDGYVYAGYCITHDPNYKIAIIETVGTVHNVSDVRISNRSQEYIEKIQLCFSPGFNPQLYNWAIPYVGNEVVSETNCRGEIVNKIGTKQYVGMVYCCVDEAARSV